VEQRPGTEGLGLVLLGLHLMVFAGVGIIFLPRCIATLSILPWERLTALRRPTFPTAVPPSRRPRSG
jgi:hypothetical protein